MFLFEQQQIIFFGLIVGCLSIAIVSISLILSNWELSPEKLSTYECGFNPFETAHDIFDIKFYATAILFVIFDVEIALLFPISEALFQLTSSINVVHAFLSPMFIPLFLFFLLLIIGLFYEIFTEALVW